MIALVLLVRLLSVVLALLQYHGFRLSENGRRLTVERGLLARWRTSASRRRIQAWTLREGLLHRCWVDAGWRWTPRWPKTATSSAACAKLAPIATPARCDALIATPAAARRLDHAAVAGAAAGRVVAAVPARRVAAAAAGGGAGMALRAVGLAGAGCGCPGRHSRRGNTRGGSPSPSALNWSRCARAGGRRHWRFAELDKLQALELVRSPIDRRCGTATLWLDTAGAGALAPPLRIRFLPEADAQALYARLSGELARRRLRW